MDRRDFLKGVALFGGAALGGEAGVAFAAGGSTGWREFELTYRIALVDGPASKRLWVPLPQDAGDYQRAISATWQGNASEARIYRDAAYGAPILYAEWRDAAVTPSLDVVARVATRDRSVDPTRRRGTNASAAERAFYLRPTASSPIDGIVKETARRITADSARDVDKARAIYEWVVENTFRDPKTKGCGIGDIKYMLESGNLGGKCADLNALYTGLARAVGLPARDVYGIRVADSADFKSLGKSGDITKAQHCRAEVHLDGVGWLPVDPADVRKVVLEEPLPIDHPKTRLARRRLFGSWEMNWVVFNTASDFRLQGQAGEDLTFFMYPHAEVGPTVLDHLDPAAFRYQIAARELTA